MRSWHRLIDGHCGIVSLKGRSPEFDGIPSQVAALVPNGDTVEGGWNEKEWLTPVVPSHSSRAIGCRAGNWR